MAHNSRGSVCQLFDGDGQTEATVCVLGRPFAVRFLVCLVSFVLTSINPLKEINFQ